MTVHGVLRIGAIFPASFGHDFVFDDLKERPAAARRRIETLFSELVRP